MLRPAMALVLLSVAAAACLAEADPWVLAARQGPLALWVDWTTGLCRVRDERTGVDWRAAPPDADQANDYWRTAYQSPIILRYLGDGGLQTAFTGADTCRKKCRMIQGGAACDFYLSRLGIGFTAEYHLGPGNRLRVNIPYDGINDPAGRLIDLRVLPYFGGLTMDEQGYAVLPDGCGGIIRPGRNGVLPYQTGKVYGERFVFHNDRRYRGWEMKLEDATGGRELAINLPIFGVVKGKAAMLGVIAAGEYDAEIGLEIVPGRSLTTVSSRLAIREAAYDGRGALSAGGVFQESARCVDYYFLPPEEASYAGLAGFYHRLLAADTPARPPFRSGCRLRIFFGAEKDYDDARELVRVTSFKQAEAMLADLHRRGLRDIEIILVGWSRHGYLGDEPLHFPPDRKFGGTSGLRSLIAAAKRLGFHIGLAFDVTRVLRSSGGFHRSETVKDHTGLPISYGGSFYLLCPEVIDRYVRRDLASLRKLGFDGFVMLEGPELGLYICYDPAHPYGRADMAAVLGRCAVEIARTNPVAIKAGAGFLASQAAWLADMPSTCSFLCDQAIPLLPMVYHGLVGYSLAPVNLRANSRQEALRAVEFGAIPNAFAAAGTVEELADTTGSFLFSADFGYWREAIIREYREYADHLEDLQEQPIIGHRQLADGVYLTAYGNGAATIVNYSGRPHEYGGRMVAAGSYIVLAGEA